MSHDGILVAHACHMTAPDMCSSRVLSADTVCVFCESFDGGRGVQQVMGSTCCCHFITDQVGRGYLPVEGVCVCVSEWTSS